MNPGDLDYLIRKSTKAPDCPKCKAGWLRYQSFGASGVHCCDNCNWVKEWAKPSGQQSLGAV